MAATSPSTSRRPLRRTARRRHAVLGRRHRADARRDRGVHHRRARRPRRRTRAHHNGFHRHRRFHPACGRARRRPLARPARQPRHASSATNSGGSVVAKSTRPVTDSSRRSPARASRSTARRRSSTRSRTLGIEVRAGVHAARSRCAATTSPAWPCTSPRGWPHSPGERGAGVVDGARHRHRVATRVRSSTASTNSRACPAGGGVYSLVRES